MASKNAAAESALGDLHTLLATVMAAQLKEKDLCTPALMNAARAFLKDNEITCRADASNALGSLKENLEHAGQGNGEGVPVYASDEDKDGALAEVLEMSKYRGAI